jgi:outer membrane murein-binding lipoprotein Lpp
MNKLLAAVVASTFALGSVAGFAANTEPLTQDQRTDMRSRADQLTRDRAQGITPVKAEAPRAPKAKKHHAKKAKKVSRHDLKKAHPQA